jgi:hypothetical protein
MLADSKLFFLATIYGMLGIPLSYLMWYRPLYRAMRYASNIYCFLASCYAHRIISTGSCR